MLPGNHPHHLALLYHLLTCGHADQAHLVATQSLAHCFYWKASLKLRLLVEVLDAIRHLRIRVWVRWAKVHPVFSLLESVLELECEVVFFLVLSPDIVLEVFYVVAAPWPAHSLLCVLSFWVYEGFEAVIEQWVALYQVQDWEFYCMVRLERLHAEKEPLVMPVCVSVVLQYQLVLVGLVAVHLWSSLINIKQVSALKTRVEHQVACVIPLLAIPQSRELSRTIFRLNCMRLGLQIHPCDIDKHIREVVFSNCVVFESTVVHIAQRQHRIQSLGFGNVGLLVIRLFFVLCDLLLCPVPRLLINSLYLPKLRLHIFQCCKSSRMSSLLLRVLVRRQQLVRQAVELYRIRAHRLSESQIRVILVQEVPGLFEVPEDTNVDIVFGNVDYVPSLKGFEELWLSSEHK